MSDPTSIEGIKSAALVYCNENLTDTEAAQIREDIIADHGGITTDLVQEYFEN